MATNQAILDQLRAMWKTGALDYIKKNAEAIKGNPELQKQIASAYTEAFMTPTSDTMNTATEAPVWSVTPPVSTAPAKVVNPADAMNTNTGAPAWTTPVTGGFNYGGANVFTPTKTLWTGIAYNEKWATDQEKYGITYNQRNDFTKYVQNLNKLGLPQAEVTKRSSEYMKQLQKDNLNSTTYGKSYGSDPAKVPTDPTQEKGTIGSLVDLNGNGIPDSQEGFGLENKDLKSSASFTNAPWGKTYTFDTSNFNNLEKDFMTYSQDLLDYETSLNQDLSEKKKNVTNENARRIIDTNNAMIGSIQWLLDERVQQNKEQYKDAVGSVYRAFWGQVKQFQRIIGSDGRAIDDATALALMGDTGTGAMAKIVDLKNQLVNQYLDQKDQAIKDIYKLQKEKAITVNEAAAAVQEIEAQSKIDVLDMTKTFYKQMFGVTEATNNRTEENLGNIRSAVASYLQALGLTPVQQNQLLNNYVKKGYSVNDALTQLSDDIRNQAAPVLQYINSNNEEAAAAAKAAFEQKLALEIKPIIAKWEVELALQNDKQEFEAEQKALDRKFKISNSTVWKWSTKELTYAQKVAMADALSKYWEWTFPEKITEWEALEIISSASTLDVDAGNKFAQEKLKKYWITLDNPSGFIESLRSTSA